MKKRVFYLLLAGLLIQFASSCASTATNAAKTEVGKKVTVDVDFSAPTKAISPYIFGVNDGADLKKVQPKSVRLGGNRMTAYNWETNKSNAGSDWHHSSDDYLIYNIPSNFRTMSGGPALNVAQNAMNHNIPYTLLTLQMAGYVAKTNGNMTKANALDGKDWCKIINRKNAPFTLKPDTTDNVVYTDEYLNFLDHMIGKSDSDGFKAYALDNEPALWQHTHPLIQREPLYADTLIEKTIDLASTIKDFDPNADVFGPSLFGYSSYCDFGPDWKLKVAKSLYKYQWFIDFYLDKMREAEETQGRRLVDVLDLHYYTEAKGPCGIRTCQHFDNDECIKARINAVRSLYDANYKESSWIQSTGAKFFPLIPNLQESVNKFYPGTKIGFTEYNFGAGQDISGAIAQADFLGVLAQNEIYFASLWMMENSEYQFAAINMFTNYDNKGGYFGDSLVESTSSDDYAVSSFVAENSEDGKLHIILTNKEIHSGTLVTINLNDSYTKAELYELDKSGSKIHMGENPVKIKKGSVSLVLNPLTVNHLILEK
ncbi:MAG: glycoside hydrolase family 44 protein [Treponema sp.]|nr:glycoside hydrolase family 44 protein [Treponema sp.]